MALRDSYGNAISVNSQIALDHYDRGLRLFLGADFGATEAFQASVDADESFALGHAAHARSLMMSGQMQAAKDSISRAQELASTLDGRQLQHIECLALLLSGQPQNARALVKAHVLELRNFAQMSLDLSGSQGKSGVRRSCSRILRRFCPTMAKIGG